MRFAYLPCAHQAQRFCRVGKRQRTHLLPRQTRRQVRCAYLPYAHPAQRFCRVGKRQRTHRLSRKPAGRCASLTCPTYIKHNGVVGWVSVSAPTVYHAKPDGRCAPLTCPTHIKRNSSVGWISISAPTFWPQRNHKDINKKSPTQVGLF